MSSSSALHIRWDWSAFLDKAFELVPFTLTKSEAKQKYGGENVFRAAMGESKFTALESNKS